jgi:2-polyprenyl-3-methyl-5-hydroxy-6-metoxy-1,4-benzoquinol methylase
MASNNQRRGRKSRMLEKLQWLMPSGFRRQRAWADPDDHGSGVLHEQRLQFVQEFVQLRPETNRRIGDLGCGAGALVQRLLGLPSTTFVLGLDVSGDALLRVRQHPRSAQAIAAGRLQVQANSFMQVDLRPWCLDTLVLLETIEHLPPQRLKVLERQLFEHRHAHQILISTPNADYNPLLGLSPGDLRHPDHQFEWGRSQF